MSFGFSVGDFVAVGKLVGDITRCLQSVGGAKSEYQELIREFMSLDAALRRLDRLENSTNAPTNLCAIKCAALSCRFQLEYFLAKAKKYERSLGFWNKSHIVRSTTDKLKWEFGLKDDIKRLQTYLNMHIGTINILLAEYGLEKLDMASRRAEADSAQVRNQLHDTHIVLEDITRSLPAQALLLRSVQSMVGGIHRLVCGELRTSFEHFGTIVRKVCVSTQQIYSILLEIRASVTIADTRWTHFQAPFIVEDALGFKFPIPSEYDYDMIDTIVRRRFKEGIGSQEVLAGNYELCTTKNISETITAKSRLLPGTAITMAVIVSTLDYSDGTCPMPKCGSRMTTCCPGGGYICTICNVRFDQANKQRNSLHETTNLVEGHIEPVASNMASHLKDSYSEKEVWRMLFHIADEDQTYLKNVKWVETDHKRIKELYEAFSDAYVQDVQTDYSVQYCLDLMELPNGLDEFLERALPTLKAMQAAEQKEGYRGCYEL